MIADIDMSDPFERDRYNAILTHRARKKNEVDVAPCSRVVWLSNDQCGSAANPHEGHSYGRASSGAVLFDPTGPYWCDGRVVSKTLEEVPDNRRSVTHAGVDAVQRVYADMVERGIVKETQYAGRPIRDNPQA